ncbi:MAG: Uma2 family endonuclease, partial [Cyanobacteria bacterium J06631_9]
GVYPGVSVIAGEATFNDDRRDEVLNPTLIVEVLSTSTEAYDRGDKFIYYRSVPTFSEYLLVSQYQPWVDHYTKSENGDWILRSYDSLKAQLSLMTGGATLNLEDIYEDVISL